MQPELVLVSQIEQAALLQAEVAAVGWGAIEFPDALTVTLGYGIQYNIFLHIPHPRIMSERFYSGPS